MMQTNNAIKTKTDNNHPLPSTLISFPLIKLYKNQDNGRFIVISKILLLIELNTAISPSTSLVTVILFYIWN